MVGATSRGNRLGMTSASGSFVAVFSSLAVVLGLLVVPSPARGDTPDVHAEAAAGVRVYPEEASGGNDAEWDLQTTLDISWVPMRDTRLRVLPRILWDPADPGRWRWVPTEAWVERRLGRWNVRGGRLALGWGSADVVNPTDLIATRDWGTDFLDPGKSGDWGVRVSYGRRAWGFETVWLPSLEGTAFPSARSPWSFDAALERVLVGTPGLDVDFAFDEDPRLPPDTGEQSFAGRLRLTVGSTDLYLVGYTGVDRSPIITGSVRLDPAPIVVRARATYLPLHAVGLEVQSAVGEFLLKGALLTRDQSVQDAAFAEEVFARAGVRRHSTQGVVGVERLWFEALGGAGDLNVLVEFIFDDGPRGDNLLTYRPLQRDLALGFTYAFNDFSSTVLEGGWVQDLADAEAVATLRLRRRLNDVLSVEAGGDLILGASSKPLSPFTLYGANDRLRFMLRAAF